MNSNLFLLIRVQGEIWTLSMSEYDNQISAGGRDPDLQLKTYLHQMANRGGMTLPGTLIPLLLVFALFIPACIADPVPSYEVSAEHCDKLLRSAYLHSDSHCSFVESEDPLDPWRRIPCDPTDLIPVYPSLKITDGWTLSGYYTTHPMDFSYDVDCDVFALPSNTSLPEKIVYNISSGELMLPSGIDTEFMRVITGDNSPESYLEASLFSSAVHNLGRSALGFDETIIDDQIWNAGIPAGTIYSDTGEWKDTEWNWIEKPPESFNPVIFSNGTSVVVRFFTFSDYITHEITRFEYRYTPGSYVPVPSGEVVATGGEGYIT